MGAAITAWLAIVGLFGLIHLLSGNRLRDTLEFAAFIGALVGGMMIVLFAAIAFVAP